MALYPDTTKDPMHLMTRNNSPYYFLEVFCPYSAISPEKLEHIIQSIESLDARIQIQWKENLAKRMELIDGIWTEEIENKSISLGKDRLKYLNKICSKKGFFGDHTFWNNDLTNLVKLRIFPRLCYLIGNPRSGGIGYLLWIWVAKHMIDFDLLKTAFFEASKAQYLLRDCEWDSNCNTINVALETKPGPDKLFPPQYPDYVKEVATHLPHLMREMMVKDAKVVPRLLWDNYWDAETCKFYGFPNPERDQRLMPRATQLPSGGWRFKLTEEPFDLSRADHREAIIWGYQRFKPIGMTVEEYERLSSPPQPQVTVDDIKRIVTETTQQLSPEEYQISLTKAVKELKRGIRHAAKKESPEHHKIIEDNTLKLVDELMKKSK